MWHTKVARIAKRMTKKIVILAACIFALAACSAPSKVAYFQDSEEQTAIKSEPVQIRIQPADMISIIVNCRDAQLSLLFNLPYVTNYLGGSGIGSSSMSGVSGYIVDNEGNIDFPVVGTIHVAGLTRTETATKIKSILEDQNLVKDPHVTVSFMNLGLTVLGEVAHPGKITINRDNITILEALSIAGDLTIYGKRENIIVLREENGVQTPYRIDITSTQNMLASPAYYLKQNDVVYVEPNDVRKRQSTVNGNNVRSTSFWLSLASLVNSIALYFLR